MKAFGQGASKHGVEVSYVDQHNYIKSDLSMVFSYKSEVTDSPNHRFRQEVVNRHNDNIFFVDSNVLKHMKKMLDILDFHKVLFTHTKQII